MSQDREHGRKVEGEQKEGEAETKDNDDAVHVESEQEDAAPGAHPLGVPAWLATNVMLNTPEGTPPNAASAVTGAPLWVPAVATVVDMVGDHIDEVGQAPETGCQCPWCVKNSLLHQRDQGRWGDTPLRLSAAALRASGVAELVPHRVAANNTFNVVEDLLPFLDGRGITTAAVACGLQAIKELVADGDGTTLDVKVVVFEGTDLLKKLPLPETLPVPSADGMCAPPVWCRLPG
jgi:hypothetical protein